MLRAAHRRFPPPVFESPETRKVSSSFTLTGLLQGTLWRGAGDNSAGAVGNGIVGRVWCPLPSAPPVVFAQQISGPLTPWDGCTLCVTQCPAVGMSWA